MLFHRLVPASLYGGQTAFPVVSGIDRELQFCRSAAAAAAVVERSKPHLFACLRARFPHVVARALALKILNICLAKHHFRARSAVVLSRPVGLVVDPSNVCRLACPGCVHSERSEALRLFAWPNATLPEERFSALLKLYGPYGVGVYFCNYGEPLLNVNTPKFIRLAKTYLLWTALSTSLCVRRFDEDAYVESGLDFMALSIDGATQNVYERFRRNGDLELVLENVRKLVCAKRRRGKSTPVLSWNFLAFEHNAHQIPLAARMARELGVNVFRVVSPFDVTWDNPEIRPAAVRATVRRLDWKSTAHPTKNWNPFPDAVDADVTGRAFEKPWNDSIPAVEPPIPGHTCHWLYKNIVMDAAGRILPCCGAPRPDASLVFAGFDGNSCDPFNSEKYRAARSSFAAATTAAEGAPYCTRCEWDQAVVNIGGPEIRRYFRAADAAFFDHRSLRLLSNW